MTFQILNIYNDLSGRLYGYYILLSYRYLNLCVKPEPASLLSASVNIDEEQYELEKVVQVAMPDDSCLQLVPMDNSLIPNICQAILLEHPEFKLDVQDDLSAKKDDSPAPKMIVLTVPPIDKDRKDALLDMVNALYDDCDKRMKFDFDIFSAKAGIASVTLPKESQDETKKEFEELYGSFVEKAKAQKDTKTKEIEDAYSRWCEANGRDEKKEMEDKAAKGEEAAFKMLLDISSLEN